jgi:peroxiredoxin
VLGVTSDTQKQLRGFRAAHHLPFTLLSDPMLLSKDALGVPVCSKRAYLSTTAVHPTLVTLPKKAFTQPAMYLWRGTELVYEWKQVEKLRNLFGANGRPSPAQILELTRKHTQAG